MSLKYQKIVQETVIAKRDFSFLLAGSYYIDCY